MLQREHLEVKWTKQVWLDCLKKGSTKKGLQYCLDSNGYILFMRAIQGKSGGNKVDLSLQDNVGNPVQLECIHLSRWFFP